ncbi:apolipoprotein D-like [Neocloeon triangulifer]|uniref:apolipoprotein D-like n=1 Tax=Neocloeon triangulifer TaxID=2078957 RepID=UPI00286F4E2B|nr:apolipoprotein D-like [Neocloeon triangulifer]
MAHRAAVLITIAALMVVVTTQVPSLGPCPEMKTMANFSISKYLGRWYQAERYISLFEFASKCVTSNYTDAGDSRFSVVNKQTSSLTGIQTVIDGDLHVMGRSDESKMTISFPSIPMPMNLPYWIMDTDYDNYAVVWSCTNFGIFSARNAWILTRSPNASLEVMQNAYNVIDRNHISRAYFIRTDQKNCNKSSRRH